MVKFKDNSKFQKKNNFKLRFAKINDAVFLFRIYNNNVRENTNFNNKPITFKNHIIWLLEKIKKKSIYIIYIEKPIGYIRLDQIDKKKISISIAMKNNYKKKGIAKKALFKVINKKKMKKKIFIASIKKTNKVSQNFFTNFGFKKIKNTENYILKKTHE